MNVKTPEHLQPFQSRTAPSENGFVYGGVQSRIGNSATCSCVKQLCDALFVRDSNQLCILFDLKTSRWTSRCAWCKDRKVEFHRVWRLVRDRKWLKDAIKVLCIANPVKLFDFSSFLSFCALWAAFLWSSGRGMWVASFDLTHLFNILWNIADPEEEIWTLIHFWLTFSVKKSCTNFLKTKLTSLYNRIYLKKDRVGSGIYKSTWESLESLCISNLLKKFNYASHTWSYQKQFN